MNAPEHRSTAPISTANRRSPLQFTLRSLIVLMALVAAFFGGRATMMPRLEEARAQRLQGERENEKRMAQRLRNIDAHLAQVQTNANRWRAAQSEVEAVEDLYRGGRVTLDLVIEAERRRALAEAAFRNNVAEYNKAIAEKRTSRSPVKD